MYVQLDTKLIPHPFPSETDSSCAIAQLTYTAHMRNSSSINSLVRMPTTAVATLGVGKMSVSVPYTVILLYFLEPFRCYKHSK